MSSKDPRIIITRQTKQESPLPTCNPNLMPFHIKYTGPAAVSMFFHVDKMKAEEEKEKEKEDVKEQNDKKEAETPVHTQQPTSTPVSSETSVLKDADTRFISSFRGRTIHGLTVDVPTGYTGLLLLHGDPQPTVSRVDRALNVPDDDSVDSDHDLEMGEETPLRKLLPQSTFSSITLWHADRAVDETRDEYYRTLTEWMALSHEVSKHVMVISNYVPNGRNINRFIERICKMIPVYFTLWTRHIVKLFRKEQLKKKKNPVCR